MKINRLEIGKDKIIQVYLSSEENKNEAIKAKLDEIKNTNNKIVLFVSGTDDTKETLEYIVNFNKLKKVS